MDVRIWRTEGGQAPNGLLITLPCPMIGVNRQLVTNEPVEFEK